MRAAIVKGEIWLIKVRYDGMGGRCKPKKKGSKFFSIVDSLILAGLYGGRMGRGRVCNFRDPSFRAGRRFNRGGI